MLSGAILALTGTELAPEDTRTMGTRKRKTNAPLTDRTVAALKRGEWAADPVPRGEGVLQLRKLQDGSIAYYFRYTSPEGASVRLPIGSGMSLAEARRERKKLSDRYQAGDRDLRAALAAEKREKVRQNAEQEAAAADRAARKRATLGALLGAYVEQLRRDGKPSARAVELAARRHIAEAWPVLWETPAADITTDDLLSVVAQVVDAGKLREAAKLRSYVTAAYAAGIRARQDARGLAALRALRITTNPARDLVPVEGASKARERALSIAELRHYWRRITKLPDPAGALLRFHLLTGAQRIEQLGRLTSTDFDPDEKAVRLRDGKGRRKIARIHDVPLVPAASEAMQAMQGGSLGPFLYTVTAGESGAVYFTAQSRLRDVVEAMAEAGELEKGSFTLGDLRRTVETRLAALGVSQEVRAQLQSHGLGGVQSKHYDRHRYMAEKRAALESLYSLLVGDTAKVTPIRKKSGDRR